MRRAGDREPSCGSCRTPGDDRCRRIRGSCDGTCSRYVPLKSRTATAMPLTILRQRRIYQERVAGKTESLEIGYDQYLRIRTPSWAITALSRLRIYWRTPKRPTLRIMKGRRSSIILQNVPQVGW